MKYFNITIASISIFLSTNTNASIMFGSPITTQEPGAFTVQVAGGRIYKGSISLKQEMKGSVSIGSATAKGVLYTRDISITEDNMGIGFSYYLHNNIEFIGSFAEGTQEGRDNFVADSHRSLQLGIKFVNPQPGPLKVGAIIQGNYTNTKYSGSNFYFVDVDSETLSYTLYDLKVKEDYSIYSIRALLGVGYSVAYFEPYFGFYYERMYGNYQVTGSDTITAGSYPLNNGTVSNSVEDVSTDLTSDIQNSQFYGLVLGTRFKPTNSINLDAETFVLNKYGFSFKLTYLF